MYYKALIIFYSLVIMVGHAYGYYSNFEGFLSEGHNLKHKQRVQENFYNNQVLDINKVESLLEKIKEKRASLKESFYLSEKMSFINSQNYSDKKASKKAKKRVEKDARAFFAFDFVILNLEDLLLSYEQMSTAQIQDKVATIALVLDTIDYSYRDHLYKEDFKQIKNLIIPFHTISKADPIKFQASNLLYQGHFLEPAKLKELVKSGHDISTLNPPNSAFWTNNQIEEFDVNNDDHLGEEIFPEEDAQFVFDRFGSGNIKIKADYFPKEVENVCETEIDNKNITFRLGAETNNHLIATNLARAIGYPYIPHKARKRVLLYLCDTSFESFLSQWEKENQDRQGSFHTHGEYLPKKHAVVLKDIAMESYPGKNDNYRYRKGGSFRTESMGLSNRREFRSLLIFNALVALVDATERNVRIDFYKDNISNLWTPKIFINDMGRSMGFYFIRTHGTVNDYHETFVREKENKIRVWWDHLGYSSKLFANTTYSDARWIARRLARLSDKQINDIVDITHHEEPVKELYKRKIKNRILNLVHAFGLGDEVSTDYIIPDFEQLHSKFPRYITKDGKISYEADEINSVTARPRGPNPSIVEVLSATALNQIFKFLTGKYEDLLSYEKIDSNWSVEMYGGTFDLGFGLRLSSTRDISINPEHAQNQKRFLIKDSILISMPIGLIDKELNGGVLDATLPVGAQYTYKFDYYHSVSNLKQAIATDFFKRLLPWRAKSIKDNLQTGEGLYVEHSLIGSLGELSLSLNENLRAELSPLAFKRSIVKKTYLYKAKSDLLEVATKDSTANELKSGAELSAYLSVSAMWKNLWGDSSYNSYRFRDNNFNRQAEQTLTNILLNRYSTIDSELAKTYAIDTSYRQREYGGCFFIWCKHVSYGDNDNFISSYQDDWKQVASVEQEKLDSKIKLADETMVLTSHYTRSTDRELGRVWTDEISTGFMDSGFNFFFDLATEGKSQQITVEGVWDSKKNELKSVDLKSQIFRNDNYLSKSEILEWERFYSSRAYCNQKDKDYLNLKTPVDVDYYSPISSSMLFQIQKKGIKKVLESYQDSYSCKRRRGCVSLVRNLLNAEPRNLEKAQGYLNKLRDFFKLRLGYYMRDLGCLVSDISDKHYWIVSKADNPLSYSTPISRSSAVLFAPEIGKFQGHTFLEEFKFNSFARPVIFKNNFFQ